MRKFTAIAFALLITTSAFAAPNDSSERTFRPGTIARIVRQIKSLFHVLDLGQPIPPQPLDTTTTP
jgi:hypothetical protein